MKTLKQILNDNIPEELLALFQFKVSEPNDRIVLKFNLWARYFFPKYFKVKDAPFHKLIDNYNLDCYKGNIKSFTNVAFRDSAKTTRTKLFIAYAIINDLEHFRKYLKILSKDGNNSTQSTTDIYNMFVDVRVKALYPNTFKKSDAKREETMSSFTTASGIKLKAGTVGTEQRGQLQDEARPDLVWFDDFETRKTLRSAVETKAIWDNMDEARTGLSVDGACIFTCNYISERGNVYKLINKGDVRNVVLNVPIIKDDIIQWPAKYTKEDIEQLRKDTEDFEGEYLNNPSAGSDVLFNRSKVDEQKAKEPIEIKAGFKIFDNFQADHRYAGGADAGGGVGLDSSATVFIDFTTYPNRVVGTFHNNQIKPETFADEFKRQGDIFGTCLLAPEKNYPGNSTVARLKEIYPLSKILITPTKEEKVVEDKPKEYGWHTNSATKATMMYALAKAVEDGLLLLNDIDLINEAKSYSRDDLMDNEVDPRLTTRHFDLLISAAIAFQMKDYAKVEDKKEPLPDNWQSPNEYFQGEIPEENSILKQLLKNAK